MAKPLLRLKSSPFAVAKKPALGSTFPPACSPHAKAPLGPVDAWSRQPVLQRCKEMLARNMQVKGENLGSPLFFQIGSGVFVFVLLFLLLSDQIRKRMAATSKSKSKSKTA